MAAKENLEVERPRFLSYSDHLCFEWGLKLSPSHRYSEGNDKDSNLKALPGLDKSLFQLKKHSKDSSCFDLQGSGDLET